MVKKKKLIKRPLLGMLNREELPEKTQEQLLTRSKRTMRSLAQRRMTAGWRLEQHVSSSKGEETTLLDRQQVLGELAYVLQPLVHLSSMGIFGLKSWTPWLLSAICDVLR